jgi:hypothetical protein
MVLSINSRSTDLELIGVPDRHRRLGAGYAGLTSVAAMDPQFVNSMVRSAVNRYEAEPPEHGRLSSTATRPSGSLGCDELHGTRPRCTRDFIVERETSSIAAASF